MRYYNYRGELTDDFDVPKDNRLRQTVLKSASSTVMVSTVFLSIDHGYGYGSGHQPVLWETMVFDNGDVGEDEGCRRYTSAREAITAHNWIVDNAIALGAEIIRDHSTPALYVWDLED